MKFVSHQNVIVERKTSNSILVNWQKQKVSHTSTANIWKHFAHHNKNYIFGTDVQLRVNNAKIKFWSTQKKNCYRFPSNVHKWLSVQNA